MLLLHVDAQFTSPYAMSVFVALTEKKLPFELHTLDLHAGAQFAAGFTSGSLTSRVPMLVDGDFMLSESSAIAEYLEDVQPEPRVYPTDARQRARARQVQAWLRSDLMPIRQERATEVVFYGPVAAPLSPAAHAAADKLFAAAQRLLDQGGGHVAGSWSLADVDLALMLNRLVLNGDAVPPALERYARAQWERPSVRAWVERDRPPLRAG